MKRRQFLRGFAGTAAIWPLTARAQKNPMPLIIVVHGVLYDPATPRWIAFAEGLKLGGYIENQNVRIEYRLSGPSAIPVRACPELRCFH